MTDSSAESDGYLVEIKPSARRSNAAVGEWVNRHGSTRRFDSKPLAREWARACTGPNSFVWIQDAVPWDESDVAGYLVGGTRRAPAASSTGVQATLDE